jgi:uncharacterized protein YcbX
MPTIQALNIYPVKSCRGIALQSSLVTPTGFQFDRQWMIVGENYRFVTQREEPRLALIETQLNADELTLRTAGMKTELNVPLESDGARVQATCWRDICAAIDMGDAAAAWLTEFLGKPRRLVRFDPTHQRLSSAEWTGEVESTSQFADAFAWLLISQSSLDELNGRLPNALPMNRFRPNIVLDGAEPFAEDRIHELSTQKVRWRLVKPCIRCAITTTDQATAERTSDEPLRTLKTYRFNRELKGVMFGQNAILLHGNAETVRVGERLEVAWKE